MEQIKNDQLTLEISSLGAELQSIKDANGNEYLWDGDHETCCQQSTFINLVKVNKNTKEECLGTCDECGDTVYRWKLEINVE